MNKPFQPTEEQKIVFEKWAKSESCNLTLSPYADSFRTYKFDRTQHMLEGWLAALAIKVGDENE